LHPIPRAHWLGHWLAGIDGRDCAESVLDYAGDIEAQVLTMAAANHRAMAIAAPTVRLGR
jgi:hypothetical protein